MQTILEDFEDATLNVSISGNWVRTQIAAAPGGGSWSLKSAPIADSGTTSAVVQVPAGATQVRFQCRVFSELSFDFFRAYIGSTQVMVLSGDVAWTQSADYDLNGATQVTFSYSKDSSQSAGLDAAFVDNLAFILPDLVGGVARPVETDLALPVDASKVRLVGRAVEVSSAAAVTRVRTRAVGAAAEVQTARPVTRTKTKAAAQAGETDQARPVTEAKGRMVGRAVETDLAQAIRRPLLVFRVAETDVALPIRRVKVRSPGVAADVEQARPITRANGGLIGQAVETSAAHPIGRTKRLLVGRAEESDTAGLMRPNGGAHFRVVRTYRLWSAGSPYRKYSR